MGLHVSLLWRWQKSAQPRGDQVLTGASEPSVIEREMQRLRAENARLRIERDIFNKATVFFAWEPQRVWQ